MNTVSKVANDIINRSPFLKEAISENLINISALARKIKPEVDEYFEEDIKEGAIIMAIKRLESNSNLSTSKRIEKVVKQIGDYLVRSNLSIFTYEKSKRFRELQSDLMNLLDSDKMNPFYTITKGVSEITIVTNINNKEDIVNLFKDEKLLNRFDSLASITVHLPIEIINVYGVYYYILKLLAWEGLNIIDMISTTNEFTIVFHQNDVDKAFRVLMQLKSE